MKSIAFLASPLAHVGILFVALWVLNGVFLPNQAEPAISLRSAGGAIWSLAVRLPCVPSKCLI
jgi:hypothetical protein